MQCAIDFGDPTRQTAWISEFEGRFKSVAILDDSEQSPSVWACAACRTWADAQQRKRHEVPIGTRFGP